MRKLQRTILINAPRERVWDVMLSDSTYRIWTTPFCPGSYFQGDWSEGSKMLFLAPGAEGEGESGLVSRVKTHVPHEQLSLEHLGLVLNGVEDLRSPMALLWKGAIESYRLTEKDDATELAIELDIMEDERERMDAMWREGLEELKKLAEASR